MNQPWHAILTPTQRAGAIAVVQINHFNPQSIGLPHPGVHRLKLVDFHGIDQGVLMGLEGPQMLFMPHGGIAIVRAISEHLTKLGVPAIAQVDPVEAYPEADCEIEAWCLSALSEASSPIAVDVLLEHLRRWRFLNINTIAQTEDAEAMDDACSLRHVLFPPTVAAVGRANVGKSSLINMLVGQQVALVADVAGTTRDHVGVPVDLGGLVVRWVDTPGVDERIGDQEELEIASRVVAQADLVVHCIDALDDDGVLDSRLSSVINSSVPYIRVGTRSDRGEHACACDLKVSVGTHSQGIAELVELIRGTLLPNQVTEDPRPWRFWASMGK